MMRLPRILPALIIACVGSCVAGALWAQDAPAPVPVPAPDAAPTTAPATTPVAPPTTPAVPLAPGSKELLQAAEDFWHYASIGRYALAKAEADKIIGNTSLTPVDVFSAFEYMLAERNRNIDPSRRVDLYERLIAWQGIPEMRDSTVQLLNTFNKARAIRAADPAFIEQNIERLGVNRRAYVLAVDSLKESGELAVPLMLAYLKDPAKKHLNVAIRSALRDMGQRALNPLCAATEMNDAQVLTWVVGALGDLGYDNAVPYLVRLLKSNEVPDAIKPAIGSALLRLNVSNPLELNPAQLFYDLAEKFYYDKASMTPRVGSAVAFMWFWTPTGLQKKDVPAALFNEHMALRCCEYVLKLDGGRGDALSLWLAAAYKREVEMPEGVIDQVWDEKHPNTHFYASTSGTRHLSPALARALRDGNAAVALRAIKSLQEIVGSANLFGGDENKPVLDALRYPDRQVRFEAAFTVAQSLPQNPFAQQQHVVPILAEAIAQTGKAGVLVVASSQDELNALSDLITKAGAYSVRGGVGADAAVAAAAGLSGIDVILMQEKTPDQVDRVFAQTRDNVRLARAAKLIMVTSKVASPYAKIGITDPLVSVTDAKDGPGLAAAIEAARKRAGGLPLDEKVATMYALRAAELLGMLAISRGQVLDLGVAQSALLGTLDDARPEVFKAGAAALGVLGSNPAQIQTALLAKGVDEKTVDELKISAFKNLANNARFFKNNLPADQIEVLSKFVETAQNPDVRAASAEALGALSVPTDQAKRLILNQAKI